MNKSFIKVIPIIAVILCGQIFVPAFNFKGLDIVADILIIFLTYMGFYYGRFYTIILGFIFGMTQDLITQIDLLGAMALTKSVIGFGLGSLALYRNIWSVKSKMLFIFLMYFLHFVIFYFIKFNGVSIPISISMQVIIMHTLISYLILVVIEKSFFSQGVTAN
jgi:rod shape-determining protein MreD